VKRSRAREKERLKEAGIAERHDAYYPEDVRTISLKLPDDLLAELSTQAQSRRVTRSALVRESLEKSLRPAVRDGGLSCYDVAVDLAGCITGGVRGLPQDLADNPAYMEDFGK
jgi:hypothetical protein